ncbi:hypothetical protein [Enterobacter hormaechei]|uniref:hypothetical protein n=1 Tax=Enterobacter hormaechei TaxID=158836 RepID=UPI002FEFA218
MSAVYTLPRYKISSYMKRQELIANALDEAKQRFSEEFGGVPADKTAVVFLADRWVAVEGGYTPDEIRDAEEYIKRKRKQKADEKAMAESSPYFVKDGQAFIKAAFIGNAIKTSMKLSPEMEKAISDVVSAELKKNLQPGGTIWTSLKRGF